MTGLHFRRYELKPGAMPDFLNWWRQIRPIRERCGFRLLFAIYLPGPNEFVSAWRYEGELSDRERVYYSDPERRRLAETARTRAERHARKTGQDTTGVVAAHPGFTTATHITEGTLVGPGALQLSL